MRGDLLLVWCEDNSVILEVLNREEENVLAGDGGEQSSCRSACPGLRPGPTQKSGLAFAGEILADALDSVALAIVEGQEFESVAEALAVAHDGADFDGIGGEGQGNLESDDLARLEAPRERGADSVLAHFGGSSPASAEFSGLEHLDLQAHVDGVARKTAAKCDPGGRGIARQTSAGSCVYGSGGGLSFFASTHVDAAQDPPRCIGLIAMQQVSRLERQLAGELNDGHGAVDSVHVHDANSARDRSHLIY